MYRGADLKSYFTVQERWSAMFTDGCGDYLTAIDTRYTGTNSGNGFRLGSWFFRNLVILPAGGRYFRVTGNETGTFAVGGKISSSGCNPATNTDTGLGLEVVEVTLPYSSLTVEIE